MFERQLRTATGTATLLVAVAWQIVANLREDFAHFYAPSEDVVAAALQAGLITPDTNVLLSLYRIQSGARDDLFRALERLGDRLWVPYQVGLEFHRNRLSVIDAQEKYFGATREELNTAINTYIEKVRAFSSRIFLTAQSKRELEATIRAAHELVIGEVDKTEQGYDVRLSNLNSDEVLARLESLLANRIGAAMDAGELSEARKEALRRVEAKIPPGYMDKGKANPSGDYLVWMQLKREAARRKVPTVFITDDRKEDWYRREQGMTLGARIELREEMQVEAGVPLLVMTTESFLVYAKKYLDVAVSPQTVDLVKDLPDRIDFDRALAARDAAKAAVDESRGQAAIFELRISDLRKDITRVRDILQENAIEGKSALEVAGRRELHEAQLAAYERELEACMTRAVAERQRAESGAHALAVAEKEMRRYANPFPLTSGQLAIGDYVQHETFGKGVVLACQLKNEEITYTIRFDQREHGIKVIVPGYARMVRL